MPRFQELTPEKLGKVCLSPLFWSCGVWYYFLFPLPGTTFFSTHYFDKKAIFAFNCY